MSASYQQTAGPSKATKFVQANPLDPMIRPFRNGDSEEQDVHTALADNVNKRLQRSIDELQQRHQGQSDDDHPDRTPTGAVYHQMEARRQAAAAAAAAQKNSMQEIQRRQNEYGFEQRRADAPSDSDDEWLDDDQNDPVLEALRERRMLEMKQQQAQRAENVAKGHGELRTITEDEFLPECTGSSEWIVVHFFHNEFQRCEILDHHLKIIAPLHMECKMLRLDAQKAPFFVAKLSIRTLPSLIVFRDGKLVDRLTGFDKLALDTNDPDRWETSRLQDWLSKAGAIRYKPMKVELCDRMERFGLGDDHRTSLHRGEHADSDDECL